MMSMCKSEVLGFGFRLGLVCLSPGDATVQFGRSYSSGATLWLEVGETEDCMMNANCKEPGCGWK